VALTCGWPSGIHAEDGWCGETATSVFLVKVHDAPLINPDAEPRVAVLTLCPRHEPATGDQLG
jgi:hypothetical protein